MKKLLLLSEKKLKMHSTRTFEILRQRMDEFGVAQPNIQALTKQSKNFG